MSPVLEFEEKNVEDALKKASLELNIPKEKIKHDVISYGSSGIFGLVGAKMAKIKVTLPEEKPAPAEKAPAEKKAAEKKAAEKKPAEKKPAAEPSLKESAVSLVEETFGSDCMPTNTKDAEMLGKSALEKMVAAVSEGARVSVQRSSEKICYEITGGNTGVLIGKKGQTLEALQFLTEKIVNKQNENRIRIMVDVEGYVKNRQEKLRALALKLGEKVKKTGKPAIVGQFNAYDRRIVHMALKNESDLRTHSVGEGYYRKLKIFPKRKNAPKG